MNLFKLWTSAIEHLACHIQKPVAHEQKNGKTDLNTTHGASLKIYSSFVVWLTCTLKH